MRKQKFFLLLAVFWILGGMVFNGYHHHQESTEANLAKPCCVCKVQSQSAGISNDSPAIQIGDFSVVGKVISPSTVFHAVEVVSLTHPRAPPVVC